MRFVQAVPEGYMIPKWFGIAWRDFDTETVICMPVPFHIMAAISRRIAQRVRRGLAPDLWEVELGKRYNKGYGDGRAACWPQAIRQARIELESYSDFRIAEIQKAIGSVDHQLPS